MCKKQHPIAVKCAKNNIRKLPSVQKQHPIAVKCAKNNIRKLSSVQKTTSESFQVCKKQHQIAVKFAKKNIQLLSSVQNPRPDAAKFHQCCNAQVAQVGESPGV